MGFGRIAMRIVSFPVSFSFASLPGGCGDEAMIFETLRRKLAENHVHLYRMGAGRPCVNEFGRSHDRRREGIRDLAGPCGLYARCDALARDAAVSDHRLYFRQCGARSPTCSHCASRAISIPVCRIRRPICSRSAWPRSRADRPHWPFRRGIRLSSSR